MRNTAFLLAGVLAGAAGCRGVMFSGPFAPREAVPARVVDLHCHTAGIGAGGSGCFVSTAMRDSVKFSIYLGSFGTSREELARLGDSRIVDILAERVAASGVVQSAVVLALDGVVDTQGRLDRERTQVYVPNEFVAAEVARHTNLLFGASINPHRRDTLERLDWAAAHGAVLVKWIPPVMEIDPSDPALEPFYRRLVAHRIPLLCHSGKERSFKGSRDELGDPDRLRLPLRLGVTVVAAHVAGGGENDGEANFDRLVRLMADHPNLYADVSALTQVNRLGKLGDALRNPSLRGRLVYGTDYPLINTALVSPWYFPTHLTAGEMARLSSIDNPWERDVAMKQALGVPADVFARTSELLRPRRP